MLRTTTWIAVSLMLGALAGGCSSSRRSDPRGRLGETISCTPGTSVEVACGAGCGLGTCTGDPQLNICEGSIGVDACAADRTLTIASNDDRCGTLCPSAMLVCPPSGSITVAPLPFAMREYRCDWETRVVVGTADSAGDAGL